MIPWASPAFWGNEQSYVQEALASTWISGGPFVERLEREISALCGGRLALAVSNGTAAIQAAYLGLGIGPGDEVVVPGFAFMAAANLALHAGAKPVFADVDPRSWCLTAESAERCLSPRTKAIVAVHTYGNMCPMEEICALGRARGVTVIEDAAESFASRLRGRIAGTYAPVATFSFQATKIITTGEGGMVLTDDPALHRKMALFRSHGMDRSRAYYWHVVPGHNLRLPNMLAALGCAQLENLERIARGRRGVHAAYLARLQGRAGITPQYFAPDVDAILWAFAAALDEHAFPQGRDAVIRQLAERKIETRPGFVPAAQMHHIYGSVPPLPVCDALGRSVISLPTYPTLEEDQIAHVCDELLRLRK